MCDLGKKEIRTTKHLANAIYQLFSLPQAIIIDFCSRLIRIYAVLTVSFSTLHINFYPIDNVFRKKKQKTNLV